MAKKDNKQKKDNAKSESVQQKVDELTSALKRERADSLNIRRHHEEQLSALRNSVKSDVVTQLLPVVDNLERALAHKPKDIENHDYVKGVAGVVKQFQKTLEDIGVSRIKTVGEEFDPNLHEAVSKEGDGSGKEVVAEELQSGYKFGDQIIRHAIVKVKIQ